MNTRKEDVAVLKKYWVFVLTFLFAVCISGCVLSAPKAGTATGTGESESKTAYYQVQENQIGHLTVTIEKASGRLDLRVFPVEAPEQNAYTGTDLLSSAFTVDLTEPGLYQADLTTERFNGNYDLDWSTEDLSPVPGPDGGDRG